MSKKKIVLAACFVLFALILNIYIVFSHNTYALKNVSFNITMSVETADTLQVYYTTEKTWEKVVFDESSSKQMGVAATDDEMTFNFEIPANATYLRFDTGINPNEISVSQITIGYQEKEVDVTDTVMSEIMHLNQIELVDTESNTFTTDGTDPYIVWNLQDTDYQGLIKEYDNSLNQKILKALMCIIVDLFAIYMLRHINDVISFFRDLVHNRKLIKRLSRNDFKTRYSASFFGIFWAFVQPFITILVYWFVFEKGLKAGAQNLGTISIPFVLFLISGMIPWFFFNDALNGVTNSLTSYTYLVKKVVFNIDILPIIKVISALYVHLFFVVLSVVIFILYGYSANPYMLQVIYYTFSMLTLVVGLGYFTSSIVVFFRDLSEIVNILLSIGVWITPIMWNLDTTLKSETAKTLFKLNPLYYIVAGYRDALINKVWFWEKPELTVYYWIVTLAIFVVGRRVFKKLRVHFADVL